MLLSSNVIKNGKVIDKELKKIITNEVVIPSRNGEDNFEGNNISKEIIEQAEMAQKARIIEEAEKEKQNIISNAKEKAKKIEKDAYDEGYNKGQDIGYEEGIKNASIEAQNILEQTNIKANKLLNNAKTEYQKYLLEKKEEIKDLILCTTEKILKQKMDCVDVMDNMIFDVLENSKNVKTFIIKCNKENIEELKSKVPTWKSKLPFTAEFFVIEDEDVKLGSAIVEKDNGKVIVGIDLAFEKIKKIIEES